MERPKMCVRRAVDRSRGSLGTCLIGTGRGSNVPSKGGAAASGGTCFDRYATQEADPIGGTSRPGPVRQSLASARGRAGIRMGMGMRVCSIDVVCVNTRRRIAIVWMCGNSISDAMIDLGLCVQIFILGLD